MRSIFVAVPLMGLLGCMATQGRPWAGGGGGGGPAPEPDAAFYCNSGGFCGTSRESCASSGIQLGAGFETACTPSNEAWCANPDRSSCYLTESSCNSSYQTPCQRFEGPAAPPAAPPPPPHRPDGPPEVVAILTSSALDPAVRPVYCRYVDGVLDAAGPAQLCPAAQSDFQAAKVDARVAPDSGSSWTLRVQLDELLSDGLATQLCAGDACTMTLNVGVVELSCDGTSLSFLGTYEAGGSNTSDPVGPALTITPRAGGYPPAGPRCTLTLSDWVTDQTGEKVPGDQRSYTFELSGL